MRFCTCLAEVFRVGVDVRKGGVDRSDDAVDQRLGGKDSRGALRDLFLNEAEGDDGFAEGDPVFAVAQAVAQAGTRGADGRGAELVAAHIQNIEGDVVSLPASPSRFSTRHHAIGKHQRTGG